eukprot:5128093-Prymnesium_polylepis.1
MRVGAKRCGLGRGVGCGLGCGVERAALALTFREGRRGAGSATPSSRSQTATVCVRPARTLKLPPVAPDELGREEGPASEA